MKLRLILGVLALAACASVERPVNRQVMVIPPPPDVPGVAVATAPTEPPPPAPPPAQPPVPVPPAAAPPLEPAAAAPAPPADDVDVIYFKPDAYKFEPAYRPVLDARARTLKASPTLHLMIQAWSDPRGARDYNLALSRKRAETVARYLVALGVPQQQLEVVAHGERREAHAPRAAPSDRRVELQYRLP